MRHYAFIALLCCAAMGQATAAGPAARDIKGGKDHPLLSRFDGARMVGYRVVQYDEAELLTSKPYFKDNKLQVDNVLKLDGKYTRIAYVYPAERSGVEVYRNYQAALAKAGLSVIYACEKECGQLNTFYNNSYLLRDGFLEGADSHNAINGGLAEPRYLVAKGTQANGTPVHVAVLVGAPVRGMMGGISLQIVEGKPMETGKVVAALDAGAMARSIAAQGKVAVYGVYFDTDKATVKAQSKEALAEMAKLLQQDKALKVHIVGHTDNQGTLAHNMELSQKRAESVVAALGADYKIDPKRLSAKGVGAYAPVASNDAEAGREKNRRVELVKQ